MTAREPRLRRLVARRPSLRGLRTRRPGLRALRELDARVVPRAAAGLRTLLDTVRSRGRDRGPDDRLGARGPLALLREVPQLALLLVAVVFVVGALLSLRRDDDGQDAGQDGAGQQPARVLALGAPVGADIDGHLAAAAERLRTLAADDPGAPHLALVSLRAGLTPAETGALLQLGQVELVRAYLRAPVQGRPEEVVFETPGEPVSGLEQVYAQLAARKAQEQTELATTAGSLATATPQEEEFRAVFEQDAATAGQEAAAYAAGCACVTALVVEGDAAELLRLLDAAAVRGIEPAARGAELRELEVSPLGPEEQGVVLPEPA